MTGQSVRTPILLLTLCLGILMGGLAHAILAGPGPAPPPAAIPAAEPLIQVLVTIPPWPTPERSPTPTPYPTIPPVPTSTPWPHYDPRYATPGRLYLIPPPTPLPPTPYPTCSLTLPAGSRCVAPVPASPEPREGRR